MDVVSSCPLRTAELRWVLANGGPALTVVCKATFLLAPGEATLAPQQDAPAADEGYWDEGPEKGGVSATDLVPFKPRADVVVVGHVYTPGGRPARSVLARLVVGAIDKSIEVFGDRQITLGGELREGAPWTKRRLGWDRAAGGPDSANPIGMRFDVQDGMGATPIPSQQPPGTHFARRGDTFGPAGFGPIAPAWPGRVHKLHRHARAILARDWPSRPLPDDIERTFWNVAPPDQQLDELRATERLVLDHLHPEHARLVTQLPGIEPTATVMRPGRAPAPLALKCDTLWIDADRGTCSLVWRGTVPLAQAGEPGQVVIDCAALAGPVSLKTRADLLPGQREALPFARTGEGWDQGRGGASDAGLPFGRTGMNALRDLASSTVSPPSPASTPGFAPPPPSRSPEGGMPRRSVTVEIPPAQAALLQSLGASAVTPASPMQALTGAAPAAPSAPPPSAAQPFAPPPPPSPVSVPPTPSFNAYAPPPPLVPAPAMAPSGMAPSGMAPSGMAPSGMGGAGLGVRPPQGSIGERLATEQAMVESKALLDRRPSGEPENIGPLAKGPSESAEAPAASGKEARRAPVAGPTTAITLLWLDPPSVPRMRKKQAFREILDELEEMEPDAELDASVPGTPADVDDHRAVFEILTQGSASDGDGLQKAMIDALREDGKLVAPLALFSGELAFPWDELETLRATVITVSPLVGAEEPQLRAAVDAAREFLKTPDLTCSPAVAEGMTQRIRDAFSQGRRVVPAGYLDAQTDRSLLDQRRYQRRVVFGGTHLRALLHMSGSQGPVPCYLPDSVSARLPLFQRFRARLLATAHLAEDQNEAHPYALKVLALARLSPPPGAPGGPGQGLKASSRP